MGNHNMKLKPVKIVIFGAGGDLTQRKLMPALYNLYLDKLMPENFAIIGVDIKDLDDNGVREQIHKGIDEFSRRGKADKDTWAAFEPHLTYLKG
ncbi:MAG: glucose-6-phosphate dehydrogenase, partial [Chloroflexi bacterium]|nr:glucose-6-phosphate dehydrogenase [Chloroflexota bacterium]